MRSSLGLWILLVACSSGTGPGDPAADDRWTLPGPHEPLVEEGVGPDGQLFVFRPAALSSDSPHPVVVWSVGTGGSPLGNGALLRHWASHGFVVVAGNEGNQATGDQALLALDWLLAQTEPGGAYPGSIDASAVAASGHSQGGDSCLHVALRDPRVRAVLPLEPGGGDDAGALDAADESQLTVPVFYVCGEADLIVPPERCNARFDNTPAAAWVGIVRDATHFAIAARDDGEDHVEFRRYSTRWLTAQLTDDPEAPAAFTGAAWTLEGDDAWRDVRRKP